VIEMVRKDKEKSDRMSDWDLVLYWKVESG